ncbi:MAG: hypothetical protein NT062_28655 [Proteobacteria bacterium]|nr:hypothetical protein [Pseudomonadota bacterium]
MIKSTLMMLVVAATTLCALPSFADTRWEQAHPRRDQVNDRLANQRDRVHAGVQAGQLTRGEARRIRREHRAIRAEERAMAARHGGHLTRAQQGRLDRQENRVSRQIERERRDGR